MKPFRTSWADWRLPLLFMLGMSCFGLSFYPALVLVAIAVLKSWRSNRYDFLIMCSIFFGEYGLIGKYQTVIQTSDIAIVVCLILWFIYRKPPLLRKMLTVIVIYIAALLVFAMLSIESMNIQFLSMRPYLGIIYLIFPLAVFSGKDFEIGELFKKLIVYTLIFSVFYILDAFIFSGNILLPNTTTWRDYTSTFYNPIWAPFSGIRFRKYPPGLFILIASLYPIARYYKLRWWQLGLILIALFATQTFTVLSGVLIAYLCLKVKASQIVKMFILAILTGVSLYYVDGMLPMKKEELGMESTLRIKSSIDQIIELRKMVDDEDLAKFASGRMAQVIPKFDLVAREGRQAIGLGFLHPEKTKLNRYIIVNEYYTDISKDIEVATGVEVVPAQIYVTIGYIGLIIHILIFLALYLLVRKLKYAVVVLPAFFLNFWFGLGGFAGLVSWHGLIWQMIAFAAVLLANRSEVWGKERKNSSLGGFELAFAESQKKEAENTST